MLRIFLFLATNLLVVVTINILLKILGVDRYVTNAGGGFNYEGMLIFCFIWGMVGSFISLLLSKTMAKLTMGVQVIDPARPGQYQWLVNMVHDIAKRAQLSVMPEVGIYQSADLNAFATGPTQNNSLVAVTTGLISQMNREELEGVIAHEVAHIKNGDMVTMALVQGVVNAFAMFLARLLAFVVSTAMSGNRQNDSEGQHGGSGMNYAVYYVLQFVFEIVLTILGSMVVAWFSRYREFRADAGSAKYVGRGSMIAALSALKQRYQPAILERDALAPFKIAGTKGRGLSALFATHPPIDDRIAALQAA